VIGNKKVAPKVGKLRLITKKRIIISTPIQHKSLVMSFVPLFPTPTSPPPNYPPPSPIKPLYPSVLKDVPLKSI